MRLEKYVADNIAELCKKRGISKYRLSQLSGISQSSLGRIIATALLLRRRHERYDRNTNRSFGDMERSKC